MDIQLRYGCDLSRCILFGSVLNVRFLVDRQAQAACQYTLLPQGADGIDSLIFKHATSTLIPGTPVVTRERRTQFGKRTEWTA